MTDAASIPTTPRALEDRYRLTDRLVHLTGVQALARLPLDARRHRAVRIATVAHAEDGNLHPALVVPPGDEDARGRAELAFEEILDAALTLGGTVTGEHGAGLLKRAGLARELPAPVAVHVAAKQAPDPHGTLNPGKVIACAPRS